MTCIKLKKKKNTQVKLTFLFKYLLQTDFRGQHGLFVHMNVVRAADIVVTDY